ncbi:MAG: DUF6675 family protein [Spirochaetia bacterium]
MKRILPALCAALLLVPLAVTAEQPDFSDTLSSMEKLFTSDTLSQLEENRSEGKAGFNRFFTSDGRATHLPGVDIAGDLIQSAYSVDYAVGVESLYLIPWQDVSARLTHLSRDEFRLEIYNTLRKISSLQGIEYYSASRERMRTLFAESWAINNPEDQKKLEDPLVRSIPEEDSIYIHQRDLTFGNNISEVHYQSSGDYFRMNIVNLTTMTYMFFPVVRKENMSMQLLIVPAQEGIAFYGLNTVDVMKLKVFYDKMRDSFTNRMVALYNWFLTELD